MNSSTSNSHESDSVVFISHSKHDVEVAESVCKYLESSGIDCWIAPRDISPGASWAGSIIGAIRRCDVMLLVFSENSNASPQVLREIERAIEHKLAILTYRLDKTSPSGDLEYFLSTVQWLESHGDKEREFRQLEQSVQQLKDTKAPLIAPSASSSSSPVSVGSAPARRPVTPARQSRTWRNLGLVGLVAAIFAISVFYWPQANEKRAEFRPAVVQQEKIAVLPFRNLSGTQELDWLRSGLSEMFITDLSQQSALRMLTSQQVFHHLAEDGVVPDSTGSLEELRAMGQSADAGGILSGSFALAGDQLEISFKLLNANTGEIQFAERSSGPKNDVFRIVNGLSEKVRRIYATTASGIGKNQDLSNVTTSSLEAYRYYSEGLQLELVLKREEAVVMLEKAIDLDPQFAMAHGRLGWIYQNLGMISKARRSFAKAFELSDNLPSRERYLIQGLHFSQRWETFGMAAESWRKALALDPTLNTTRHQLAIHYGKLEMFAEAIELWEALRNSNFDYAGIENGLAHMYYAIGEHQRGEALLEEMLATNSGRANAHLALGFNLVLNERADEALEEFNRALTIQPAGPPYVYDGMWRAYMTNLDYPAASAIANTMKDSDYPHSKWRGWINLAKLDELHGRTASALTNYRNAIETLTAPNEFRAMARVMAGQLLLSSGEVAAASIMAKEALNESLGDFPEWEAHYLLAQTEYLDGDREAADRIADKIYSVAKTQPGDILLRMHHHLLARFAMADGDFIKAIEYLREADASLSPHSVSWHLQRQPDHATVWFDLGIALLSAGNPEEASEYFRKLIDRNEARLEYPALYTRSFYYLAKANESMGKSHDAVELYGKFIQNYAQADVSSQELSYAAMQVAPK